MIVLFHFLKIHLFLLLFLPYVLKFLSYLCFRYNSGDNNFSLVLCQTCFGRVFLLGL